jgi:hypothetical protein
VIPPLVLHLRQVAGDWRLREDLAAIAELSNVP